MGDGKDTHIFHLRDALEKKKKKTVSLERRERIEERGSRRTEEEERERDSSSSFVSGEAIIVRGVGGTPNHIGIIV